MKKGADRVLLDTNVLVYSIYTLHVKDFQPVSEVKTVNPFE